MQQSDAADLKLFHIHHNLQLLLPVSSRNLYNTAELQYAMNIMFKSCDVCHQAKGQHCDTIFKCNE